MGCRPANAQRTSSPVQMPCISAIPVSATNVGGLRKPLLHRRDQASDHRPTPAPRHPQRRNRIRNRVGFSNSKVIHSFVLSVTHKTSPVFILPNKPRGSGGWPPVRPSMRIHRGPHAVRRQRHVDMRHFLAPRVQRIDHRIHHRRRRANRPGLAAALSHPTGCACTASGRNGPPIERQIIGPRHGVIHVGCAQKLAVVVIGTASSNA